MGSSVNIQCYFKVLEWTIYIGFCILAAFFMKDVIDQYQAKETYLGQSLKPITNLPTLVFCVDHKHHQFKINQDITISYFNNEVDEQILLEKVLNHVGKEILQLKEMTQNCFKINLTSTLPIDVKKAWRGLDVKTFGNTNPENFYVYVTSKARVDNN